MPPRPYDIYLLLPGFDCGACEASTCSTFARRLASGRVSSDLCPFLEENCEKLEKIAAIAEFPRLISGKNVSMVKPCLADSAKVMGEAQLVFAEGKKPAYGFFDAIAMKHLLGYRYPDMKFSFKLGSAKLQLRDGSKVLFFENGYISVREAKDAETLNKNIEDLAGLLWGAAICPRCASTVLESTCGGCGDCQILARPALVSMDFKQELNREKRAIDFFAVNRERFKQLRVILENSSPNERDRAMNFLLDKVLDAENENSRSTSVWLISLVNSFYRAVEAKSQAGNEADLLLRKTRDLIISFDVSVGEDLMADSGAYRIRMLEQIKRTRDKNLISPLIIANSAFYISSSFFNPLPLVRVKYAKK